MESLTTNVIHFPTPAQDPNPPVRISEILPNPSRLREELLAMTPERAARLKELKAALKIPQEAQLSTLAIPFLVDALEQKTQCPKCAGRSSAPCRMVKFRDNWEPYEIPCPLQEARRQSEKAAKLMRRAGIPDRYKNIRAGVDFEVTAGNRRAVEAAVRCIDDAAGLYVFGAAGVGKTMLVSIIANERARQGKPSLFVTVPDMLEELREFDNPDRRAAKLSLLYETPCLIIDDLGAERATPWVAESLFRVFNARYNAELQTIVTSNFSLEKISSRLPDYAGERVVRRIAACCLPVYMER